MHINRLSYTVATRGGESLLPLGWGGGDGNRLTHIKNDLFDTIAIYSRI